MTRTLRGERRSVTVTITERPVAWVVTRMRVPRGRLMWAAVSALLSNVSPLLVRFPAKPGPYHDA